jgi:hypothetical protein
MALPQSCSGKTRPSLFADAAYVAFIVSHRASPHPDRETRATKAKKTRARQLRNSSFAVLPAKRIAMP